jgi:heme-degrading monooxygenase HmoA
MLVRIVQMTFEAANIPVFLAFFESRKHTIRAFDGCKHLELWQDKDNPAIIFTYSIWDNEAALNHYRFSQFFKETWTTTKTLFADQPKAWSVNRLAVLD